MPIDQQVLLLFKFIYFTDLASFADEYRKLAIDCLKVLRVEMQLETIFHMQIARKDEEMAPFVAGVKRINIFGGICSIVANASIKVIPSIESFVGS
ncbi:hypothetical protein PRUPE_5G231200 [Prunus persica]|uniref:Exocyst complex component Sec8 n=1 Tax=Prunus persica TaxID=3760 RepID=A0A251PCM3_PRUPE|nr:hypothetical protein PRUPE_5G231200 [Prunus persica]